MKCHIYIIFGTSTRHTVPCVVEQYELALALRRSNCTDSTTYTDVRGIYIHEAAKNTPLVLSPNVCESPHLKFMMPADSLGRSTSRLRSLMTRVAICALTLATATPSFALLKPIISPSQCTSGVLCCDTIESSTSILGPILPGPQGLPLVGLNCDPITDLTLAPLTCNGITACCPPVLPLPISTSTSNGPIQTASNCNIVDISQM